MVKDYMTLTELDQAIDRSCELKEKIKKDLGDGKENKDVNFFIQFRGIKFTAVFSGDFRNQTFEIGKKIFKKSRNTNFYIDDDRGFSFEITELNNLNTILDVVEEMYNKLRNEIIKKVQGR